LGRTIEISSAYRCPQLNAAVGGAPSSQHVQGLAADFVCPDFGTPLEIALAIGRSDITMTNASSSTAIGFTFHSAARHAAGSHHSRRQTGLPCRVVGPRRQADSLKLTAESPCCSGTRASLAADQGADSFIGENLKQQRVSTRPSMMCTLFTPPRAASRADPILGSMPPDSVPSATSASILLGVSPVSSLPFLSNTPGVLVSTTSFSARSTSASLPATKSALML